MDRESSLSEQDLPRQLAERLSRGLPGRHAQRWFAPQLSYGRHRGPAAVDARQAAVLVLLYPGEPGWRLPLTLRPAHLADHGGQVSFPGGMQEPGESPEICAVRELEEELGIDGRTLQLLGRLTPVYVFASNFAVVPCVAVTASRPEFRPNRGEVAALLELPLDHLVQSATAGLTHIERRGLRFLAPCFFHDEHAIWGATAMMLAELRFLLAELSGHAPRPPERVGRRGLA